MAELAGQFAQLSPLRMRVLLLALVQRVDLRPDEVIVHLRPRRLAACLDDRLIAVNPHPVDDEPTLPLSHPVHLRRAGKEVRMVINHTDSFVPPAKPDRVLIRLVVRAHRFHDMLIKHLAWPPLGAAHEAQDDKRLPVIGPAPGFALTSQDGAPVTLAALRGKIVAVSFIYTACPDICPLLTQKMVQVQDELGPDFGAQIAFVSITLDPARDTPEVLRDYAQLWGAKLEGWSFLTGSPEAIRAVTFGYGAFAAKNRDGGVDHTQLTSIVDAEGAMRVQYLGARFDPEEFRRDLLSLLHQP